MNFKILNEAFTSDDLYDKVADYIKDYLIDTVYDLDKILVDEIDEYKSEYASNDFNNQKEGDYYIGKAAEFYAEDFIANAPEIIKEDLDYNKIECLNEDIEGSDYIGSELKEFLKDIDHRTKINIESESGYDYYGNAGDTSGMSGLAHDVQWFLADRVIKDINIPEDIKYYEYKIIIE